MDNAVPKRKDIRLRYYDYSSPGAYYVTICTDKRRNILWNKPIDLSQFSWKPIGANCVRPHQLPLSTIGKTVTEELEVWNNAYPSVYLHSYVIMPNHLHIMIVIQSDEDGRTQFAPTVSRMVKQFKGAVTKKIGSSIWQKSFMEHIVRDKEDYRIKTTYILQNPARWYYKQSDLK